MKTRLGFVSNSSSASFQIRLTDLTEEQIDKVKRYMELSPAMGLEYDGDWEISTNEFWLVGTTSMDNDDICEYLSRVGINPRLVAYEGGY